MTDIETISEKRHIYSETGKTSPLSDLPTSSPFIDHSEMNKTQDQLKTNGLRQQEPITTSPKDSFDKKSRSKSIISDESSDLSELDSEAETERMYDGESQLSKIAKQEDGTTIQDDEQEDETIIKEEFTDQLEEDKDSEIEVENEEFEKVVERIKSTEPETEPKEDVKEEEDKEVLNEVSDGDKKRKLSDGSIEPIKRRKTDDEESRKDEEKELKEEDDETQPKVNGKIQDPNEPEDIEVEEGGDEDEDEEDEVEDELTEEQKIQKQEELEIELTKQKQAKEAIQYLTEIEIEFAQLRDRLYQDKMTRFKSELEMCLNGSHPELQNVYDKIDSYREEKIKLATLSQKYKFECIDRKTKATRTSIHQNFIKRKSDFKNEYLSEITQEWYKINKERRTMDSLVPEYSYHVAEYVEDLIEERESVNKEISILMGLSQYYGFPKAPELKSISNDEMDQDLREMSILR